MTRMTYKAERICWIPLALVLVLLPIDEAGSNESSSHGRIAYLAVAGDFWQAFVMEADGSRARQVTRSDVEKAHVDWFPDGERLLVSTLEGRLIEVSVESGKEVEISLPVENAIDAVVAPNGNTVAFSGSTAEGVDGAEIWTANLDGTAVRIQTRMEWLQHEPAWDAQGEWIYFASGDGKQTHDLWRVSTRTGSREQLTAGAVYNFAPVVSADGTLAFSSNRSGNYEIWVQSEAESARMVTEHPALDGAPVWASDDQALLFHSTRSGTWQIWSHDLKRNEAVQLTHHEQGARDPAWWPRTRVSR